MEFAEPKLEGFVEESKGDKGVYLIDGQVRKSNTSEIAYGWGLDKTQVKSQFVEPGVREVIRRIKETGKVMSQAAAIEIAYEGIQKRKESFTVFGTDMHKQFENFELKKPVKLPTPKHEAYFRGFAYFRKSHTFDPILIEGRLHCTCHNLTTQIDWFGQVDDLFTVCDYKTGRTVGAKTPVQLAINKHVLECNGYIVQQLWAVHVQEDFAYPVEFNMPWAEAEIVLKNAEIKERLMCPKVYIRKMANEDADNEEEQENVVEDDSQVPESNESAYTELMLKIDETKDAVTREIEKGIRDDQALVNGMFEAAMWKDLDNRIEETLSEVQNAVKRGRGRPKGSLNKKTLLRTDDEVELVV